MPRRPVTAVPIERFCSLIDDKGDPGDLFVKEAMRARYAAAVAEMIAGARPPDLDLIKQFAERQDQVAAAKSAVLNAGEALARKLEAANIDPLLLRRFLEYVRRDEFARAERICPRVEAFLRGTPARARAGGAAAEPVPTEALAAAVAEQLQSRLQVIVKTKVASYKTAKTRNRKGKGRGKPRASGRNPPGTTSRLRRGPRPEVTCEKETYNYLLKHGRRDDITCRMIAEKIDYSHQCVGKTRAWKAYVLGRKNDAERKRMALKENQHRDDDYGGQK